MDKDAPCYYVEGTLAGNVLSWTKKKRFSRGLQRSSHITHITTHKARTQHLQRWVECMRQELWSSFCDASLVRCKPDAEASVPDVLKKSRREELGTEDCMKIPSGEQGGGLAKSRSKSRGNLSKPTEVKAAKIFNQEGLALTPRSLCITLGSNIPKFFGQLCPVLKSLHP
eukprot:2565600-Amphidinium_carterae.2